MIPAVDISPFLAAPFPGDEGFPSSSQKKVAVLLDEVCCKTSSVRLTGIPNQAVFRNMLKQTSRLFDQPAAIKDDELMQFDVDSKQGYFYEGAANVDTDTSCAPKEVSLRFLCDELKRRNCPRSILTASSTDVSNELQPSIQS